MQELIVKAYVECVPETDWQKLPPDKYLTLTLPNRPKYWQFPPKKGLFVDFIQRWGMRKKWWTSPYHNLTFLKAAWYKTWKWIRWGHCLAGRCRKEADNWCRSENENCERNSNRRLAKNMRSSNLDKKSSSWQKVVQFSPEMRTKNLATDRNIDSFCTKMRNEKNDERHHIITSHSWTPLGTKHAGGSAGDTV